MTTSDMIWELCEKRHISLAEICRRIGQIPQNFNKKLKRNTVSFKEMSEIAEAVGVCYEQAFNRPLNPCYNSIFNSRTSADILEDNVRWLICNKANRDLVVGVQVTISDINIYR